MSIAMLIPHIGARITIERLRTIHEPNRGVVGSAQIGRVDQSVAGSRQLSYKRIPEVTIPRLLERILDWNSAKRKTRYIDIVVGVHRNASTLSGIAEIGRIDQIPRRIEFRDECTASETTAGIYILVSILRREIGRKRPPGDICIALSVDGDGIAEIKVADSAEVCGVDQHWIDNERPTPIICRDREPQKVRGAASVSAFNDLSAAIDLLIGDRLVPPHVAHGGVHHEVAGAIQNSFSGPIKLDSNAIGVCTRPDHKVVFELRLISVIEQVDARVHVPVAYLGIVRYARMPALGKVSNEVVARA